ncbi:phage tail tape measure protein [Microvirga sp. RSM25]|uniref:phage tail tape measure protein n=1 Tax=Microvirga sp. RSM25 TaxID=3273802 RepID=UPI00384CA930
MANLTSQLTVRLKDGVSGPAGKAARSIKQLDRAAKNAKGGTHGLARSVNGLEAAGAALDGAGLSALALRGGPVIAGALAVGATLKKGADSALSFEKAMYEVEKATNSSGSQAQKFADEIVRMSKETGKTKEEIAGMMAAAGYAGRPVDELARFTEYAAKATSAWGTSTEATGQAMAVIGNIYGANQQRIEEIGDAINTAADVSATGEKDLLEFIKRTGATGKQAGLSAEQVLAFGAAMGETGTPMEVAATGFESLLNVMKLGSEFSKSAGEGLAGLGISSDKMRKQFVAKPLEATLGLLNKINKVADPMKRAEILTNIFGKEYQDDIQKLMNALPRLNTLLGTMGDRSKYLGSVQQSFELWQQKDFAKIERAERAVDALMARLGKPLKLGAGWAAEEILAGLDRAEARVDALREKYNKEGAGGLFVALFKGATQDLRDHNAAWAEFERQSQRIDAANEKRHGDQLRAEQQAVGPGSQALYGDDRLERSLDMPLAINAAQQRARRMADDPAYKLEQDAIAELQNRQAEVARARAFLDSNRQNFGTRSVTGAGLERKGVTGLAQAEAAAAELESTLGAFRALRAQVEAVAGQIGSLPSMTRTPSKDTVAPTLGAGASFGFGPGGAPVDTSGLDAAKNKAAEAGQAIQGLNTTVAPQVNTAGIDTLNAKLDAAIGKLARLSGGVPQQMASREIGRQFEARRRSSYADYEHA